MTGPPPPSWAVDPAAAGAREVVPGLWRLRLPMNWPGVPHVNAYAIEREDGILLVDCGSGGDPSCTTALELALAAAGHRIEEVSALALTHVHTDHVGLGAVVRERSGATVFAHPDDDYLYGPRRDPAGELARRRAFLAREGVPAKRLDALADVTEEAEAVAGDLAADVALRDGVAIESALGPWRALETPGHSPGHVCLIQDGRRIAIVGDLVCGTFAPWFEYGWSEDPVAETMTSWDRLDACAPQLALPGHGRPIEALAELTASHRQLTEERLAATRARLAASPMDAWSLCLAVHGDADDNTTVANLAVTLADLRHLWRRGDAERRRPADGTCVHVGLG